MFAGIIFVFSLFQYESPRFLVKKGKDEEALKNLCRLRNLPSSHPYVENEFAGIKNAHQTEMEATMGSGPLGVLKETFQIGRAHV